MNGLSVEPGRADRAGHVDLPGAAVVEIIRRADMGDHVAAVIVDGDDADRNVRAQRHGAVAGQRLEGALDAGIQRQPDHRRILHQRRGLIGGMRRQDRHRLCASAAPPPPCASARILGRDAALMDHPLQHAVARRAGRCPDDGRAGAVSGDCGSATSNAASASDSRFGSLPK